MRLLPRQPAQSAQLVLADPPYGINYVSRQATIQRTIANDDGPYIWWLREAWRVVRDGGALICFTRWDVAPVFEVAIKAAGFRVRSQLVWHKPGGGMGDCKQQFAPSHEMAWFAVKGPFAFPGPRPMSVATHPAPRGPRRTHPCQKPVSLLASYIEATTRPGDLVIDPFCGSGASIVACVRTDRRGLGIELDHKHVAQARRRVAHERTLHARGQVGPDA